MSDITLIPRFDSHGSVDASFYRYVFGVVGSPISGVIYLNKDAGIPDKLILMFNKYTDKADIEAIKDGFDEMPDNKEEVIEDAVS